MSNSSLSSAVKRKNRLHELEVIIYANQLKIGEALSEIRDNRLYRDEYSSFDSYCQERWGHNRSWADRLIKSVNLISTLDEKVDDDLDPIGSRFPLNESQARALRGLLPDQQKEVMDEVAASGQKVTAPLITKYAQKYQQESEPEEEDNWDEEEELEETEIPNPESNSQEEIELLVECIRQIHRENTELKAEKELTQVENAELKVENAELKKEKELIITFLRQVNITWTCRP